MPENTERTDEAKDRMAQVARVAKDVELKDIRVITFSAKQSPELIRGQMDVQQAVSTEATADAEAREIRVIARFTADAHPSGEQEGAVAVSVAVTFELAYESEVVEELSEDALDAFGAVNGVYNAWPYWREFIQNTTARMGLPPLIIPVFRLSDHLRVQREQEGTKA